ncbi:hypothetical protein H0H93_005086, partial [Arthromyces matolae]
MSAALSASELARTAHHLQNVLPCVLWSVFTAHSMSFFHRFDSVMLFYDIAITFGDEIERIWLRRYTPMTVLWTL